MDIGRDYKENEIEGKLLKGNSTGKSKIYPNTQLYNYGKVQAEIQPL